MKQYFCRNSLSLSALYATASLLFLSMAFPVIKYAERLSAEPPKMSLLLEEKSAVINTERDL